MIEDICILLVFYQTDSRLQQRGCHSDAARITRRRRHSMVVSLVHTI